MSLESNKTRVARESVASSNDGLEWCQEARELDFPADLSTGALNSLVSDFSDPEGIITAFTPELPNGILTCNDQIVCFSTSKGPSVRRRVRPSFQEIARGLPTRENVDAGFS